MGSETSIRNRNATRPHRAPSRLRKTTDFSGKVVDAAIRVGLVVLLAMMCLEIVRPFMVPLIWGVIIAIASYPGFVRFERAIGGRSSLAATVWTLIGLILLLGPVSMIAAVLVENVQTLSSDLSDGALSVPEPPDGIVNIPVVGEPIHDFWGLASSNLGAALNQIGSQLQAMSVWLLAAVATAGLGILQFMIALIIAGVLLTQAAAGGRAAHAVAARVVGERGPGFVTLAEGTIRGVTRGVLGTAMIQSTLAGIGLVAAGVPGGGLLAFVCLLFCTIQVGPGLVLIPSIIYVFWSGETLTAVLFTAWSIPVMLLDNVLRPILIGRGVDIPIVVILIGVIGGLMAYGLIGVFLGPVVVGLGYELFRAWVKGDKEPSEAD